MASVSRNCTSNQPRLRSVPAIHATAVAAYGAAADARSPTGLAAIFCHASTACVPTRGSVPSHAGGGGMVNDRSRRGPFDDLAGVGDDRAGGERQRQDQHSSHAAVMAATASFRRPQSHACSRRITGHVATTIIEAQMIAPRKGRRIQTVDAISATMNSTPSVVRGRSGRGGRGHICQALSQNTALNKRFNSSSNEIIVSSSGASGTSVTTAS